MRLDKLARDNVEYICIIRYASEVYLCLLGKTAYLQYSIGVGSITAASKEP